ncbi:MAG: YidC/Oxa1 family membrane protein insertase [Clostridia bacterium]|nr:YidC/Oxa1 family membrane protein insertase [Clostridia bacterium]
MTQALRSVLEWIYGLVGSYGVAVLLFTLLIRTVLTPLEISSRKGMRKMALIQPKLTELQKKYANDQARLQQKQQELMKKEHYNPLSGCLPLLIQWPILFVMFYAMRDVAGSNIIKQAFTFLQGETPAYEPFLWVRNVFMADSPFKSAAVDSTALMSASANIWQSVVQSLSEGELAVILENIRAAVPAAAELSVSEILNFADTKAVQATVNTYLLPALQNMEVYQAQIAAVSGWKNVSFLLFSVTLYKNFNGLLILPILSGVTQVFMTKLNPSMQTQQQPGQQQSGAMNAMMKYFFPIFSVFICLSSNAGFALYWCAINIFATGQSILINRYLDKKDAAKAAAEIGEGTVK